MASFAAPPLANPNDNEQVDENVELHPVGSSETIIDAVDDPERMGPSVTLGEIGEGIGTLYLALRDWRARLTQPELVLCKCEGDRAAA